MKIAVTYENGEIFQHFGRTEQFKLYNVEENKVVSSEIISSNGSGHSALAILLSDYAVDVLICGGIGGGAQSALAANGIQLCAGATGNADEAVEAFLKGELFSQDPTCDHHHEHGHDCHCGNHDDCSCSKGKNTGKKVRVHYKGTFDDGTVFDSSYGREPLEFVCGQGMMIKGFDEAVANMEVGQVVNVHLMPEDAYGPRDPNAILEVEISQLPGSENLEVGQQVYLTNTYGQQFMVKVIAKDDVNITFDANHEMAGKELNFQIELLEVM